MQTSGLHLHVNPDGNDGLHGTHNHDAEHGSKSHEADTDVSILKLAANWLKLQPYIIPFEFFLLTAVQRSKVLWAPVTNNRIGHDQSRWRPPLRAPPIPVS
jgi:hypothetical protein